MRLLITGINGLFGTILRNALQGTHTVYGLDREGEFSEQVLSADISEYPQVARVVKQFSPLDAIIHLAGNPNVDASWESVLNSNIIGMSLRLPVNSRCRR
jgi:nucleoside-diphosphate-sugar epimerase